MIIASSKKTFGLRGSLLPNSTLASLSKIKSTSSLDGLELNDLPKPYLGRKPSLILAHNSHPVSPPYPCPLYPCLHPIIFFLSPNCSPPSTCENDTPSLHPLAATLPLLSIFLYFSCFFLYTFKINIINTC